MHHVPVINPMGKMDEPGKWKDVYCNGLDAIEFTTNYVCKMRANIIAAPPPKSSSAMDVIVLILYILVSFSFFTYCFFIVYAIKCSPRSSVAYLHQMSTTGFVDDE